MAKSTNPFDPNYGQEEAPSSDPFSPDYAKEDASKPTPTRSIADIGKDAAITLGKGVVGAGQGLMGLADIGTLGYAGKLADKAGVDFKTANEMLDSGYSDAQKAANKNVADAHGFGATLNALKDNPSVVANTALEQVPQMLAMGKIGKAAAGVKALGIGEGLAPEAAQAAKEAAAAYLGNGILSAGNNAEATREQNADGTLSLGQTANAIGQGAVDAGIGKVGGTIAKELGGKTLLQASIGGIGGQGATTAGQTALAVLGGASGESLINAAQGANDTAFQNVSNGRDIGEGVGAATASGAVLGAALGGATSAAHVAAGKGGKPGDALPDETKPAEPAQPGKLAPSIDPIVASDVANNAAKLDNAETLFQSNKQADESAQAPIPRPNPDDISTGNDPSANVDAQAEPLAQVAPEPVAPEAPVAPTTVPITDGVTGKTVEADPTGFAAKAMAVTSPEAMLATANRTKAGELPTEAHVLEDHPDSPNALADKATQDAADQASQAAQDSAQEVQAGVADPVQAYKNALGKGDLDSIKALRPAIPDGEVQPSKVARLALAQGDDASFAEHAAVLAPDAQGKMLKEVVGAGRPDLIEHLADAPDNYRRAATLLAAEKGDADSVGKLVALDKSEGMKDSLAAAKGAETKSASKLIGDAIEKQGKPVEKEAKPADKTPADDSFLDRDPFAEPGDAAREDKPVASASVDTTAGERRMSKEADPVEQTAKPSSPRQIELNKMLHSAVINGDLARADKSIKAGADVNSKDGFGETPLHKAVESNGSDMIDLLHENGADLNARATGERTPLHIAVDELNGSAAHALIERGADVNAKNENGDTPLHSLSNFTQDLARPLLDKGADPSLVGSDGMNAFDSHRARGQDAVANTIGEHLAQKEREALSEAIPGKDGAAAGEQAPAPRKARRLSKEADPIEEPAKPIDPKKARDAESELIEAAARGDVAKIHELIDKGVDVNAFASDATDFAGDTALHVAGSVDAAKALLERGANPSLGNDLAQTPSQWQKRHISDFIDKNGKDLFDEHTARMEKSQLETATPSAPVADAPRKARRLERQFEPATKTGDDPVEGHTHDELKARVQDVLNKQSPGLGDAVVNSEHFSIRSREDAGVEKGVHGFVDGENAVTLVHDNIGKHWSDEDIHGLLKHELGVHAIQLGMGHEQFKSTLDAFRDMKGPRVDEAYARVPKDTPMHLRDEEALAYFVQNNKTTLSGRVATFIKSALRSIVGESSAKDKSAFAKWLASRNESELVKMATDGIHAFAERGLERTDIESKQRRFSKEADAEREASAKPVEQTLVNERLQGLKEFQRRYADMFASLGHIVTRAKKIHGEVADELNPMHSRDLEENKAGVAIKEFDKKTMEPLAQHLRETGVGVHHLDEAWAAIHSEGESTISSGMKPEKATEVLGFDPRGMKRDEIVKKLGESEPELAKAVGMVDKMNQETFERLKEAGMKKEGAQFDDREKAKLSSNSLMDSLLQAHQAFDDIAENNFRKRTAEFIRKYDTKGEVGRVYEKGNADPGNTHRVSYLDNGQSKTIFFNKDSAEARSIAKAFNFKDKTDNWMLKVAGSITKWISNVNTHANPIFGIKHGIRNAMHAGWVMGQDPRLAGKQGKFLKNQLAAYGTVFKELHNQHKGIEDNSPRAQQYREFQRAGGEASFNASPRTAEEQAVQIKKLIDPSKFEQSVPKKAWNAYFEAVHRFNHVTENATRFAIYQTAIGEGVSKPQALSMARNLTVNFNRRGTETGPASKLFGFFNANVQGTAALGRALFQPGEFHSIELAGKTAYVPKLSKGGVNIILGGITAGVAQAFALQAAGINDGDIQGGVLNENGMIPIGGKKTFSVPIIQGLSVIPMIGRLIYESIAYGKPLRRVETLIEGMAKNFVPLGGNGLMNSSTYAPSALDPIVGLATNDNGMGSPIAIPNRESLKPTPGTSRNKQTDSSIGKGVAALVNVITGGTDYKPGGISPTGSQIDYLMNQIGGAYYSLPVKAIDTVKSLAQGDKPELNRVPLVSTYVHDAASPAAISSQYYERVMEMNGHADSIKGMSTAGKDVSGYLRANPEAKLVGPALDAEKQIGQLQKNLKQITAMPADTPEAKARQKDATTTLKAVITQRQSAFNELYDQVAHGKSGK